MHLSIHVTVVEKNLAASQQHAAGDRLSSPGEQEALGARLSSPGEQEALGARLSSPGEQEALGVGELTGLVAGIPVGSLEVPSGPAPPRRLCTPRAAAWASAPPRRTSSRH